MQKPACPSWQPSFSHHHPRWPIDVAIWVAQRSIGFTHVYPCLSMLIRPFEGGKSWSTMVILYGTPFSDKHMICNDICEHIVNVYHGNAKGRRIKNISGVWIIRILPDSWMFFHNLCQNKPRESWPWVVWLRIEWCSVWSFFRIFPWIYQRFIHGTLVTGC